MSENLNPRAASPVINKITPPSVHRTAKRQRLFKFLDETAPFNGLWISGPAGAGKTTLASSYLAERRIPCVWHQIDVGDTDPATFFYYLGLAVDRVADRPQPQLPVLTPEYLIGMNTFAIRFFEKLTRRFERPIWIVFDNFQEVLADSALQSILCQAVEHAAGGVKICFISRAEPGQAMSRLLANRLMCVADWPQLKFTVDEYRQVLQAFEKGPEVLPQAETLHSLTDGWIAGLILWLQNTRGAEVPLKPIAVQTPSLIFDYFASEVFDHLETSVRHFLLQVSFLSEIAVESARRLTGEEAAEQVLENLVRCNFFLDKRNGLGTRFQFHSLFRSFLQKRALKELPAETLNDLQCRSAEIMAEDGLQDESVKLYGQAGAWDRLTGLILSQAPVLAAQGRFGTLTDWLNNLPQGLCEENPWLLLWHGISRMPTDPWEGQKFSVRAFERFKASKEIIGQVISWTNVVDAFLLIRSGFQNLDRWIDEGLRIGGSPLVQNSPEIDGRFCAGMLGALMFRRPNHLEVFRWQQKCESLLLVCTDQHTISALLNALSFSYTWIGQIKKARALRKGIGAVVDRFAVDPLMRQFRKTIECNCLLAEGRPQQCQSRCEEALQHARETGIHIYDSLVLSYLAHSTLLLGRFDQSAISLKKMSNLLMPEAKWEWAHFYFISAWAAILKEDMTEAAVMADKALDLLESCSLPFNISLTLLLHAQAMLGCGDISRAEKDLNRCAALEIHSNNYLVKYLFHMTAADLSRVKKNEQQALGYLRQAFSAAEENGIYLAIAINPKRLADLCVLALEADIHTSFIKELIKRNRLNAPASCSIGDCWPYHLKLYTLGRQEIRREEKSIAASLAKTPVKIMELLTVLICAGRRGLTREAIADMLWPETDGDRAQQNMNTTLHRLRKMLKREETVISATPRLFLSSKCCWVDAWSFEEAFDLGAASSAPAEKEQLLRKAFSLYTGPFSAYAATIPSRSYAERLKSKFVRTGLELGWLLGERGQLDEALEVYQRGLDVEQTSETLYQSLIRVLNSLGRGAEAIEAYHRCCTVLKEIMGTEPSPATLALVRKKEN